MKEKVSPKKIEVEKDYIKGLIEFLILNSSPVNEGSNGIIKSIDLSKLPANIIKVLSKINPDAFKTPQKIALKMLKIYRQGDAKREFESQKMAYDLVTSENASDLAKIPQPFLHEETEITSKEAQDVLIAQGLNMTDNKVEIILMDFIKGEDLAEYLYRAVIKKHPQGESFARDVDEIPLDDLQNIVGKLLGFSTVGKHTGLEDKRRKEEAVNNDNLDIMLKFLEKNQFVMDKTILERVKKTISLLNANNFYHRDLHERNIMIEKDNQGKIVDIYIVDFGSAKIISGKVSPEEIYSTGSKRLVDDMTIFNRYQQFTLTLKEKISYEHQAFANELKAYSERIKNSKQWKKLYSNLQEIKNIEDLNKLLLLYSYEIGGGVETEDVLNTLCAVVMEFSKINNDLTRQYILSQFNGKTNVRYRNKLSKIIDLI